MRNWSVLVLVLGFILSAFAQQTPSDVVFGGEHFFRFRASAGGLSPEGRAVVLQGRFTQVFTKLLAQDTPLTVRIHSLGTMKSISIAGVPFVTITPKDAEANQMTVEQLAKVWTKNLEWGLRSILGVAFQLPAVAQSISLREWLKPRRQILG